MRTIALLLLLANLLFLAWGRWVAPQEPSPATSADVTAPAPGTLQPIRLRGEPGTAPAAGTFRNEPNLLVASCVSIGPFAEPVQAEAAAAELTRLGYSSRARAATDDVRVGSWVRVSNLATPADATNALAVLQAAGLTEASLVADPEEGGANLVSVGVYADPVRAAAVGAEVTRAGFTAETIDHRRTQAIYWLDVDREANGGLPSLEALPAPPPGGLPLELRACPDGVEATVGAPPDPTGASATESSAPARPGG